MRRGCSGTPGLLAPVCRSRSTDTGLPTARGRRETRRDFPFPIRGFHRIGPAAAIGRQPSIRASAIVGQTRRSRIHRNDPVHTIPPDPADWKRGYRLSYTWPFGL
ncbi:hypothetical protein GCM10022268_26840 [Sphingomonas cynarae]|uniref:Uncharacterized protein n=1 Tax=Sphingomonas cynarae TaxID=930197 RepID=A0ABP7EGZ8_9SPHN